MEAALVDSEAFQDWVKNATKDVALAEWLAFARAKDVPRFAVSDEIGKQLCYLGVKVNEAVSVFGLGNLSLASPHRLFDPSAPAIEVPNLKADTWGNARSVCVSLRGNSRGRSPPASLRCQSKTLGVPSSDERITQVRAQT